MMDYRKYKFLRELQLKDEKNLETWMEFNERLKYCHFYWRDEMKRFFPVLGALKISKPCATVQFEQALTLMKVRIIHVNFSFLIAICLSWFLRGFEKLKVIKKFV